MELNHILLFTAAATSALVLLQAFHPEVSAGVPEPPSS
jgi:hypothetical protein